jgi:hypothetical protein
MIARRETTNLGQQPHLLQGRCDTCVHAADVSTTTLPTMHSAPILTRPYPPYAPYLPSNLTLNPQCYGPTGTFNRHR